MKIPSCFSEEIIDNNLKLDNTPEQDIPTEKNIKTITEVNQ